MPTVQFTNWHDFRKAGIEFLTGEACGLMLRVLCDVTEKGRLLFCKTFGLDPTTNKLGEPWNGGSKDAPHVGSVMLSLDQLPLLSVFACLETGVPECYVVTDDRGVWRGTYGFAPDDRADLDRWLEFEKRHGRSVVRRAYQGTAGDRNRHVFSGRVE